MQKLKNKTMAILIAAILTISMSASMILLPGATAAIPATTTNYPTDAFIDVSPNPDGVGQSVFILGWLLEFDPATTG
jgi:hypothetical protein